MMWLRLYGSLSSSASSIELIFACFIQVGYAANSATPFLSTGGGHGFAITLGRLQHGIELDLSNFKNVSIDTKANRLTIGGAVRFRDVIGPLGQANKELRRFSDSSTKIVVC
jgi:hypothetical protein